MIPACPTCGTRKWFTVEEAFCEARSPLVYREAEPCWESGATWTPIPGTENMYDSRIECANGHAADERMDQDELDALSDIDWEVNLRRDSADG